MSIISLLKSALSLGTMPLSAPAAQSQPTGPATTLAGKPVKYMVSWNERPFGSAGDYEDAQKRILQLFQHWAMPVSLKFEQFVVRVGDWGGYAVVVTDDPGALHKMSSAFAAFQFKVETVMEVADAVAIELEAIGFRDGVK